MKKRLIIKFQDMEIYYINNLEIGATNISISNAGPDYINYTNNTTRAYVKRIDLEIGNKCIDTLW